MSKQMWMMIVALALFIPLFIGNGGTALAAETEVRKFNMRCNTIDEQMKEEIEYIIEILVEDDVELLKERLNNLLTSSEMAEEERDLMEVAICLDEVNENRERGARVNGYHSLLVYAIKMKQEEAIQFEELTFNLSNQEMYLQIEGALQDNDIEVHIDHYYANMAANSYWTRDLRLKKEKLKEVEAGSSPFLIAITESLSSSAYQVIQNPIEKFMMMVDRYYVGKAEKERELFVEKSAVDASYFNMRLSFITSEKSEWKYMNMVEYYPSSSTYSTFERAARVQEELPDYWYPKEEIEQGDWDAIVAYYKKHQNDMRNYDPELYDYIFGGVYRDSANFKEMMDKVKNEHMN